ncbi:hypothetical protein BJX96DRAFT_183666 [Aspergillus floccosus]
MSSPNDYNIGWICAIKAEYVAAQAFLDEKHEGPEYVQTHDNNDYTLGKIGKHNVVIAVLPHGEYGISSATGVAKDMLHSFPNVRIGLMVGIGGGAPSPKHDIRLGDIVVGASGNGKSAVLQYDFGKMIQDQEFQETGFLNQPPKVLRTALHGLMAQYELDGHQLEEGINSIFEKKPRLRQKYKRPDPSSDRLYRAEVTHPPNSEASCAAVCGDEPSDLIPRRERTKDEDNPAIHYGLVASANRLMKDARLRDKFAKEKDVLCFEMEAAGLMNEFPCLVIRGICDYSDTHKNKEWQGYAAMAAAAYAKDLLCRIPPNMVEAEKRISEQLHDVLHALTATGADVAQIKSKFDRDEDIKILKWLSQIDYALQQKHFIRIRQPGTAQWFLDSSEYQVWLKTDNQILFCPGIPGAGKTIITATIIDDLYHKFQDDTSIAIAYLYCDFRRQNEQKLEDLLANLLKQLTQRLSSIPDNVRALYKQYTDQPKRPSLEEISTALHSVSTFYSKVFIVIDALDECQVTDGCRTRLLHEIFNLRARQRASMCSTSRFIPEILEQFKGCVSLKIRARDADVQTYLAGHMTRLPPFVLENLNLQDKIKATISKAVDGMFLLASLHIDSLAQEPTEGHLERALQKLPKGLDETHGGGSKELARKVLSWLTHAKRLMSTAELQHAVAVEPGQLELNEKFIPTTDIIGSLCSGLVTIDTQSDVVRLVHYTTQEYFERTQKHWFPDAETDITKICVTYLSFNVFESGFCSTYNGFKDRLKSNKLFKYAAQNWGHHARMSSIQGDQCILDFLQNKAKVSACTQAMRAFEFYVPTYETQMTGLHVAAYFGLEKSAAALLDGRHSPSPRDVGDRTPLDYAAVSGLWGVVKLLLEEDADPNIRTSDDIDYGQTPLHYAVGNGHQEVVKLLLDKGADPNIKTGDNINFGQTPLHYAVGNGHQEAVKLLLDKGADPNVEDSSLYSQTPLHYAAKNGHQEVVKFHCSQTPLDYAAENGDQEVVKLLLDKGADPNVEDSSIYRQTPLHYAARNGHQKTPLHYAAENGDQEVNCSLYSQTPLHYAADNGHQEVVKLLLDKGADPNTKNSSNGHQEVVKLLLDKGATPLDYAAVNGHQKIVNLLLEKGADLNIMDSRCSQTPLHHAARNGHQEVDEAAS